MTKDWADPEGTGLLRKLGQDEPPGPGVLEAARETLWSAVAEEMLSAGPAADTPRTDRSREDVRRRRTGPGS